MEKYTIKFYGFSHSSAPTVETIYARDTKAAALKTLDLLEQEKFRLGVLASEQGTPLAHVHYDGGIDYK